MLKFKSLIFLLIPAWLFAGLKAPAQEKYHAPALSNPKSWSIILLPDPQGYTKFARNQAMLNLMTGWIREQKQKLNIRLVLCTGDLVEQNFIVKSDSINGDQPSSSQWACISNAFSKLDHVVPYVLCTGNHDYGTSYTENRYSQFNSYFPPDRNPANMEILVDMAPNASGVKTLENACYELLLPQGRKMLIFSLEYAPSAAVVQWAAGIAAKAKYAGHIGVVLTHSYMESMLKDNAHSGEASRPAHLKDATVGAELWKKLIFKSSNIQMVYCGHVVGPGHQGHVGFRVDHNSAGVPVNQMLFNAQNEGGNWQGNGGDGWLRILEFLPDGKTVLVKTFSPFFASSPSSSQLAWRTADYDQFSFQLHTPVVQTQKKDSLSLRHRAMYGPTIQIDPTFPYYQHRSNESIADEIFNAGYRAVHYFVVNENEVNGPLIDAFRARGMPVWLMAIGNGTYDTKGLPAGWAQWKMQLTKAPNGGDFTFFSLVNQDFIAWKKQAIVKLLTRYPFDGVELAESYFPEWDAIKTGRYGDVGPAAKAAFFRKTGMEMPDFVNPESAAYYTKNPAVYQAWVQFRVDAVNEFLNEIYNGENGVRQARPDVLVATWSMGVQGGAGAVSQMRTDHGLDAVEMVRLVKPDVHFFQTHWPDWIKPEAQLRPGYVKTYAVFADPVRKKFPGLALGFQADQGSGKNMIKSDQWRRQFDAEVQKCGYATWTTYEYHLGGAIYDVAPKPLTAVIIDQHTLRLSFNKRVDAVTGGSRSNYSWSGKTKRANAITNIKVDGNLVFLSFSAPLLPGDRLSVKNVTDTPALRLYKDTPLHVMQPVVMKITLF